MSEPIPFPPAVAGVLGQLTRQIALLAQRRDAYATGALAALGVETARVDFDALSYTPTPPPGPAPAANGHAPATPVPREEVTSP